MGKPSRKFLRPYDCNNMDDAATLKHDNFSVGGHWLLTDGETVTLCKQQPGESADWMVEIPTRQFNRLIAAYMRPQDVTPKPRKRKAVRK